MKHIAILLAVTSVALTGCDAWFSRRMDVVISSHMVVGITETSASRLVGSIREYASANGIACSASDGLPIECFRQPIRIWAVATESGATVCYSAMGIPLESSKFERRMNELEGTLVKAMGRAAVSIQSGDCPPPPFYRHGA